MAFLLHYLSSVEYRPFTSRQLYDERQLITYQRLTSVCNSSMFQQKVHHILKFPYLLLSMKS